MKVDITIFKDTGKYYTFDTVHHHKDMDLWKDEFIAFVYENLPARYSGGYVVVRNADPESNQFYEILYKYDDLQREYNEINLTRKLTGISKNAIS